MFQGMNQEMSLRKHQRDVAARIIYSGTALMAHEVGAGKTAAMITAGMYLKMKVKRTTCSLLNSLAWICYLSMKPMPTKTASLLPKCAM
ncbi:hypothetical protein [Paenibacillus popilliae]|uniref:hypothetical protein n=1 Tax=Paenibacillus popilliae TaxID=78057 RepID=UPI0003150C49|nr:hypothetical protein [Paenibacillus popilliae]